MDARMYVARALACVALTSAAHCGRTGLGPDALDRREQATDDDAQTAGDPGGDPGGDPFDNGDGQARGAIDWRIMSKTQWDAVDDALSTARAAGVSGEVRTTAIPLAFTTSGWAGAVLAPNGRIYGIPFSASHVIEIDPTTTPATVREVGPDLGTAINKWHGAVLDASGIIVGVPYSSFELLLIDVRTDVPAVRTVQVVSNVNRAPGSLWVSAVRAYDGRIHMVPGTATTVLAVDMANPDAPTFEDYGDVSMIPTSSGQRYGGGALEPSTGLIYAAPYGAGRALAIDPVAKTVTEVGDTFNIVGAWYGVVTGANGVVYGMPSSATDVLSLTSALVSTIAAPSKGCDSGVTTAVGVFCLPYASSTAFVLDVFTNTFRPYEVPASATERYSGGALAPNGHIYAVPVQQNDILDLDTRAVAPLDLNVLLGGFLNAY